MSTYRPLYTMEVRAPRSVDATEATILTPAAGAAHADQFKVSSAPLAGYKAYMNKPRGRRGRLDILSRRLDTGQLTVRLLDKRLGASNLTRWIVSFLGNAKGVNQLTGCKVVLQESLDGGVTLGTTWTGRITRIRKVGSVGWDFMIRDMADELGFDVYVGQPHESVRQKEGIGNTTSASATFTIPSTSRQQFAAADVGKRIVVAKAGASGADLETTIAGYTSATQVTLGTTAGATLAGTTWRAGYAIASSFLPAGQAGTFGKVTPAFTLTGKIGNSAYLSGRKAVKLATTSQLIPILGSINLISDALLDTDVPVFEAQAFKPALIKWSDQVFAYVATTGAEKALQLGGVLTNTPGASLGSQVGLSGAELLVQAITETTDPDYLALPADGTTVQVQVRPRNLKPSEDAPLWLMDVHPGELARDILEGDFSYLYTANEKAAGLVPAGKAIGDQKRSFPYDAAAFAAMIADVTVPKQRFKITQRATAIECLERLFLGSGYGFALDELGQVTVFDLRLSSASLTGLATLTDDDQATDAPLEWEHGRDGAITRMEAVFYEDIELTLGRVLSAKTGGSVGAIAGKAAPGATPTGRIFSRDRPLLLADFGRPDLGEEKTTLDLEGYRTGEGELVDGVARAQAIEAQVVKLLAELKGPFGAGPNEVGIRCRRSATVNGLRVGSLVLATLSRLPDPATNAYGGTRLLRVLEKWEEGLGVRLTLLDHGPNVVAVAPTLGALGAGADTKHQLTAALTLNANADPIAVEIAVTATSVGSAPAETSVLWKRFSTIYASATITVSNLPPGSRVWVRARSEPRPTEHGRIPSAWVFSTGTDYVDTVGLTAPSALATSGISQLRATLSWTVGDATLWTELWLASPSTDATALVYLLPPGTSSWAVLGTVSADTYKAEIRHTDRMGGYSAFATAVTWTATGTPTDAPALAGLALTAGS